MGASVLQDLVVVMVVAAATTVAFYRLRQPVVLGYLLAGALIGPFAGPFNLVGDTDSIHALAELGLIFLLFALGLEFNLRRLRRVGSAAVVAAVVQIGLALAAGYWLGLALGWSPMDAIFLGAIISVASTTIIAKVLMDMGKVGDEFAEITFGILIVEDVFAVVLVALLGGLADGGALNLAATLAVLAQVGLYVLITLAVGLVVVPRLIEWVARHHVEELLVITVVGLAFLNALLAIKLGLSAALGAFLAGALIAESRAVKRVEHKIIPLRDLFTAVFFVAVGMLFDPVLFLTHWEAVVLISVVVVVVKALACGAGVLAGGYGARTGILAGLAHGQIGEFSFIIAGLGLTLGLMSDFVYPVTLAVSIITTMLTPLLVRWGDRVADPLAGAFPERLQKGERAAARARLVDDTTPHGATGGRPVFYAAWLLGLLMAAAYASLWLGRVAAVLFPAAPAAEAATRAAALTVLGLLALPLFTGFQISTEKWFLARARRRHLEPGTLARNLPSWLRPRVTSRVAAVVTSLLLTTLALRVSWGVRPFHPDPVFVAPVILVVVLVTTLAWPHLRRVYLELDNTLDTLLGRRGPTPTFARAEGAYPWGSITEGVPVTADADAAYRPVGALPLPGQGARLIGIERAGRALTRPHQDLVLLPGDRVYVLGRQDQVESARRLLTKAVRQGPAAPAPPRPTRTVTVRVSPASLAIGNTLADLAMDDHGIRVLQHARGSWVADPAEADLPLRVGDTLRLSGSSPDLETALDRWALQ